LQVATSTRRTQMLMFAATVGHFLRRNPRRVVYECRQGPGV